MKDEIRELSVWQIDKQFDFCYGHRVWSQELNTALSLDGCLKCRHLHGHQGKIKIGLESNVLNLGMVTDFKHLNWAKKLIDDWLDHKFILDINDPLLKHEVPELYDFENDCLNMGLLDKHHDFNFYIVKIDTVGEKLYGEKSSWRGKELQAAIEKYEGLVFVDFIPTSENLCKLFCDIAVEKMKELYNSNVSVTYVDYWETPKSHCRYIPGKVVNND